MARVILLILDSVGVGEAPDAAAYGDEGSNTLGHVDAAVGGLALPNLGRLGIGNVVELGGTPPAAEPIGAYGTMAEASAGKDSVTGHWELAGVVLSRPFPTFPHGFPEEVIRAFERAIGRASIGNVTASGTEIIRRLGPEHLATGAPIIYTSADSVFQVAAHVDVVSPTVLKDFAVAPPGLTILDAAAAAGLPTTAIGKVGDLFSGRGIGRNLPAKGNEACMAALHSVVQDASAPGTGLVFANLVDFDMLFGHRNDPAGYAEALRAFDQGLGDLLGLLRPDDVLIVSADHGNDPTTSSTDHSRELVPVLAAGRRVAPGRDLRLRGTFADVAATVAELLAIEPPAAGASFASLLASEQASG